MKRSDDKFFVSKIKNRLISTLILSLSLTLAACHYYPVAADDFSVLDNDVLSDLVRNSHGSGNQTGGSYGVNGPGRLDKSKLELLVKNLFAEQELIKIETTFVTNGGACLTGQVQKELRCNFIRKWRLKNIGAPFDTSNWSDPAAKIDIRFMFDDHGKMRNLTLEIIDANQYKIIRG
ncbi:hypothetical protein [Massilia violaceinigra]|uniref:hypothetical protein n=1 Tax=Massilia violaceinigra TaxID=2045208 RepID=UPI0012FD1C3D|nr:hypothetical protein [Massilia violaceinigra]